MSPKPVNRRLLAAIAASAMLSISLAACSTTAEPAAAPAIDTAANPASVTGTITLMRNPGEINEDTIAAFNEVFPNVKVEMIDVDPINLKALQAAGTPPDLFRVEAPTVPPLVAQGQLMDLTTPLSEVGITGDTTFKSADLYLVDGKRYGAPNDWSPDFNVYVNNKLFEAAGIPVPDPSVPLSWQEFAELAKQLTISDGTTTSQFGFGGAWDTFGPARVVSTAVAEGGKTLYAEDQESINLVSNPDAMDALEIMADMAKAGYMHSPANPSASWSGDEFTKGTIAMISYGYWYNSFLNKGDTAVGFDYTVLPAPYWKSEANRINPTITGTGYVMSSKTKNPQAAWAFLNWYAYDKGAIDRASTGHGFPTLKANVPLLPQASDVDKQAFEVVSLDAEVSPALQFNRYYDDAVFTDSYNKYLQDYIKGSIDLEAMAQSIENDVNAAIQDGVQQFK